MNKSKLKREKIISLFLILLFSTSVLGSTPTVLLNADNKLTIDESSDNIQAVDDTLQPKLQATLYTDEPLIVNVGSDPDNFTHPDVGPSEFIIGEPDGNYIGFHHYSSPINYGLFRLEQAIISDMLVLKNFDDLYLVDTIFELFGWSDPYTIPDTNDANETYIDDQFTYLGTHVTGSGDITFHYDNISLEYLLLIDHSVAADQFTFIDAIEVHGFTSFIADENKDEIPDIWEYADVNITATVIEEIDLFGYTFEVRSLVGTAPIGSTQLDFLQPFIKIGLVDEFEVDETHFYIMCQTELRMPFPTSYEYLQFLNTYDLVNMTYIELNATLSSIVFDEFDRYYGQDQRIRTWQFIDYTGEGGSYDPINYDQTAGQIGGKYDTLDTTDHTTDTAQEKFDLDVSIVLDIVENVLDAVIMGKDLVEQFMGKIVGFIQGKVMDGVSKKLLEKLAKKALKSAIKCIFSITTVKDIVVKGIMILAKLGVPIPSWLKKVLDFVTSIPFIDPPVEIWKIRLTFLNETTQLPILGYDYLVDTPIYTHPKGIYFGDTYSTQVILSSRDIFPVVGRIQIKNASRVVTGNLYVEDLILEETSHAKSSLEPDEFAQGRMYPTPPDGLIVISQCMIDVPTPPATTLEADNEITINFFVTDENGTLLSDISKVRTAVNNLPDPMIEIGTFVELDGSFTIEMQPADHNLTLDYHMIATLYKIDTMFHDYWNHTFILQDTIAPEIDDDPAILNTTENKVYFSAKITDFGLNTSSILITITKDSSDPDLGTAYPMTYNGTHYVFEISTEDFYKSIMHYRIEAKDYSNNLRAISKYLEIPKKASGFAILLTILPLIIVSSILHSKRKRLRN